MPTALQALRQEDVRRRVAEAEAVLQQHKRTEPR